jgi:multicomponent Na+:H+ antiporter subunit F
MLALLLPIELDRVVLGLLTLALVLAFVRMLKGPELPDRVVALDLMSALVSGMLGAAAVIYDEPVLIDIAIVVALITFLGTIGFARYIEKRAQRQRKAP